MNREIIYRHICAQNLDASKDHAEQFINAVEDYSRLFGAQDPLAFWSDGTAFALFTRFMLRAQIKVTLHKVFWPESWVFHFPILRPVSTKTPPEA